MQDRVSPGSMALLGVPMGPLGLLLKLWILYGPALSVESIKMLIFHLVELNSPCFSCKIRDKLLFLGSIKSAEEKNNVVLHSLNWNYMKQQA